jgi:hypothetical protein
MFNGFLLFHIFTALVCHLVRLFQPQDSGGLFGRNLLIGFAFVPPSTFLPNAPPVLNSSLQRWPTDLKGAHLSANYTESQAVCPLQFGFLTATAQ